MKSQILPVLNAIGCLALTGVVVMLWNRERTADQERITLLSELTAARNQAADEARHSAALELDIATLKESIEATRKSAAQSLMDQQTMASAAEEQVKIWQAAITERDAKLRSLNAELTETRKRLDEAIARIKGTDLR